MEVCKDGKGRDIKDAWCVLSAYMYDNGVCALHIPSSRFGEDYRDNIPGESFRSEPWFCADSGMVFQRYTGGDMDNLSFGIFVSAFGIAAYGCQRSIHEYLCRSIGTWYFVTDQKGKRMESAASALPAYKGRDCILACGRIFGLPFDVENFFCEGRCTLGRTFRVQ